MDNSSPKIYTEFLPISRADMEARGWEQLDFVVVGGDAYVDHPSFGTAIISRLLEAEGYKVGVLAQPRYTDCEDFKRFGKPKYGFFIGGGNVDSMVSHYSVAKIPRAEDEYSPGGKGGARPDRSATVYTRLAKQAYPDLPVILGGLEASLRRFAHYDYWLDTVLPSIAEDSGADIISFGMGEHQTVEIARRLAAGEPVESITDVDGTCYMTDFDHLPERYVECAGFKKVASDKTAYAKACRIQMDNQDVVSGQIIVQKQSEKYLVHAIGDMKRLWKVLKQYGVPSYKVSERIITQMVFSETLYEEEHIFEDYYLSDNVYFRLKQAYLAYVTREYIVYGRSLEKCVFEIIANECDQKEDLPDVCKIALLKYYSDKEYTGELEDVLHQVLREMCEKQLVFPYYMNYKEEWLREVQLYNKVMAAYRCKPGGKVRLYYKMKQKDREELGYRAEAMMPVYENLYVKQFVLYNDESVNYYFQESGNGEMITTDKKTLKTDKERVFAGKYQMLNAMTDMDSDAERSKAMLEFEEEEQMADQIFKIY